MHRNSNSGRDEFKEGWPILLATILGIGLGVGTLTYYGIGLLAPELCREFGWGFGAVMTGTSIMMVAMLVAAPLVGILSDRYGVRRITLLSVSLFSVCWMSFALSNGDIRLFYANWLLMAIVGAGTFPDTWTRAVNSRFAKRRGLALGVALLGSGVFGSLLKPLIAFLITAYGWRITYIVTGALPLIFVLPVGFFALKNVDILAISALERHASCTLTPGLSLLQALREWRFWLLMGSFGLISFATGGPIPNLENILGTDNFSHNQIVSMVSLIGIAVVFGRLTGGWLVDRFWAPAIACILLLCGPASACWLLSHRPLSLELAGLAVFLIGFGAGMEYDLLAYIVVRYFGMKSYGAIYGSLYGAYAICSGLGVAIFGRVFDATGSYSNVLLFSFFFLLGGGGALTFLGRYREFEKESLKMAECQSVRHSSPLSENTTI